MSSLNGGNKVNIKEIDKKYGIKWFELEKFIKKNNLPYKETLFGEVIVDDENVKKIVELYKYDLEEQSKKNLEQEVEDRRKKKAMSEMLITSGFNFDGYTITKYSGYISGDDAVAVDRGLNIFFEDGKVKDKLMESLVTIRRNALRELKEAAYALGCNAVIGVDFDYLTLDPQTANIVGGTTYQPYVFGVTANGNAVVIEKNKE